MHPKSILLASLLAIAVVASGASPARGQTGADARVKSPPRTAQRSAPSRDALPASNTPPDNGPARGSSAPGDQPPIRAGAQNPRQPSGQAPAGAAPPNVRAIAPKPPFELTESQQKLLDQILIKWEKQSDRVSTFKCSFDRWEIDPTFGPKEKDGESIKSEGRGVIKYKSPDRGEYRVTELREWDDQKNVYVAQDKGLDHWVCDGKSIFEFDSKNKKLVERKLPPEMQGKAIADGPLPFVFGAKADQLKRRYWMRDVTPQDEVGKTIWLEAVPKFQQDMANFRKATIILNDKDFMPAALRIFMPGDKAKMDFAFNGTKVNDPLSILKGDFLPPLTPLGWTKVVEGAEPPPGSAAPGAAPAATEPAQAARPAATRARK